MNILGWLRAAIVLGVILTPLWLMMLFLPRSERTDLKYYTMKPRSTYDKCMDAAVTRHEQNFCHYIGE